MRTVWHNEQSGYYAAYELLSLNLKFRHVQATVRTGWMRSGVKNYESVADHSWRMAMLPMLMDDGGSGGGVDRTRCIKMALVHPPGWWRGRVGRKEGGGREWDSGGGRRRDGREIEREEVERGEGGARSARDITRNIQSVQPLEGSRADSQCVRLLEIRPPQL